MTKRCGWLTALKLCLVLLVATGCSRSKEAQSGLGRRVASGLVRFLEPSPDGRWLAYLDRCARPPLPDLPPDVVSCDLALVSTTGGEVKRLAEGVSSLGAQVVWSGDSQSLAALAEYDYLAGRGKLVLLELGSEPRTLSDGVGFFGFAPDGDALVFVARERLKIKRRGSAELREVAATDGVSTFEFNPARRSPTSQEPFLLLAARRTAAAGGELFGLSTWEGQAVRIASQVGDYRFVSPGWLAFTVRDSQGFSLSAIPVGDRAKGALPRWSANVQRFSSSPATGAIAYLANVLPGKAGDLLVVKPGGQGKPEQLAKAVGEYRWASAVQRLGWLQDFDARVRSGTLAVGAPGERPVVFGRNIDSFDLASDGARIAYLEHVNSGGYSVDLKLAEVKPGGQPEMVARGVFGFSLSPDGKRLYYRTNCVRNAEACDLYVTSGAPSEKPRRLAEGMKSFEFDRHHPERLLVSWSRKDLVALDLAVLQGDQLTAVDQAALPGSARFLGPDSRRLAYVVAEPKRAGVYVAELP